MLTKNIKCTKCGAEKPLTSFHKSYRYKDGHRRECKQCRSTKKDPVLRFWSRVDTLGPDDCWNWKGALDKSGYARVSIMGERVLVHRMSWELSNQMPVPAGLWVLHHCDNRRCCNPNHLYVGTIAENTRDAIRRNRYVTRCGEDSNNSKLTEESVRQIRAEYKGQWGDLTKLGNKYGVSHRTIFDVVNGVSWSSVP